MRLVVAVVIGSMLTACAGQQFQPAAGGGSLVHCGSENEECCRHGFHECAPQLECQHWDPCTVPPDDPGRCEKPQVAMPAHHTEHPWTDLPSGAGR
jgi:hypothetical protein